MNTQYMTFKGFAGTDLPAVIWLPDHDPKCILQITHGMTEHIGRYDRFAAALCREGIAVAGFDLRGHGKNPGNREIASFGEEGWMAAIEDMRLFFGVLQDRFPGTRHVMLGFSLGSFLLREYLCQYPQGSDGAIIAGTGHQPGWLLTGMMGIVNGQIRKAGFDNTTDLVRQLSFGAYNQKCKPNRTSADWLCSDERELDAYLADPLVRKDISSGLFWELLGAMKRTGTVQTYESWGPDMPILLIGGGEDPVGDSGKGVNRIYRQMKTAGLKQITCCILPGARHDIFHEVSNGTAELVAQTITRWLR